MPPPSCIGICTGAKDRLHRRLIHRPALEGAVEVDHMQPLEALLLEGERLRRRDPH